MENEHEIRLTNFKGQPQKSKKFDSKKRKAKKLKGGIMSFEI